MTDRHTEHAQLRCAQRHFDDEAIAVVEEYGREVHRTGVIFIFLGRRDLPEELRRKDCFAKLEGTTLLMGLDGHLITVYRNRRALPKIKKKLKHRMAA